MYLKAHFSEGKKKSKISGTPPHPLKSDQHLPAAWIPPPSPHWWPRVSDCGTGYRLWEVRAVGPTIWSPLGASGSEGAKGASRTGNLQCNTSRSGCQEAPTPRTWPSPQHREPRVTPRSVPHGAPGPAPHTHPHQGTDARAGLASETPGTLRAWRPQCVTGRADARHFSTPTSGGRHARPVGRLSTPAAVSASKNETATSRRREASPRRWHVRQEARLSRGASPARPAHPEDPGLTPRRRPPASPLPPTRALDSGRCARRRRGRGRAGRGVAWGRPARPRPHRPAPALRGVASAQVGSQAGENFFSKVVFISAMG